MKVLGLDLGVENLSWCLLEFREGEEREILSWRLGHVYPDDRFHYHMLADYVMGIVKDTDFTEADVVVIEQQVRGVLKVLECAFHVALYPKAVVIRPSAVKTHFGIKGGNHRLNKRLAVDKVLSILGSDAMDGYAKKDDLCDSFLLALYYFLTNDNR